jgi:hypothetical protein
MFAPPMPPRMVWPARALLYALIAFLYHHAVGGFAPRGGDEPHFLMSVISLLQDGDFNEANNYRAGDFRQLGLSSLPRQHPDESPERAYLGPEHGIGLPILLAVPFWLGGPGRISWFLVLGGIAAALALAAYAEAAFGAAIGTLAGLMLVTLPVWEIYSAHVYTEVPGATLAMVCYAVAMRPRPARLPAILCGLCLAYLPFLYFRFLGPAVFLAWIAFTNNGLRRNAWFLAPLGLALAAEAFLSWHVFHNAPLAAAPAAATLTLAGSWERFWRLLFDRTHGVVPAQPVVLLAFWSVPYLILRGWRHPGHRLLAIMACGVALSCLPFALIPASDGDCPPGRYLCWAMPFLLIFAFHWALRGARLDRVRLFTVLALWGVSAAICIEGILSHTPSWQALDYYQHWFPAGWPPPSFLWAGELIHGNSAAIGWLLLIAVTFSKAVHRELSRILPLP